MAFARHWLYAFGGLLNQTSTPNEIWQCGVRVALFNESAGDSIDEDTALNDWQSLMNSWWNGLSGNPAWSPTNCGLSWLKINEIGPDGHQVDPTTHVFDYSSPHQGVNAATVPDILGLAITFRTGKTRPPGAYGRVYLPAYSAATTAAGSMRITAAAATLHAAAGGALLTTIAATLSAQDLQGDPVVASRVDGINRPITQVSCGDVLDVQRRRKNELRETYVNATNYP